MSARRSRTSGVDRHRAEYVRRGEAQHASRLTERAVRAIRANRSGMPAWQQALVYCVHVRTIEKVLARETWGHVQ